MGRYPAASSVDELADSIDDSGAVITHDELPNVVADGSQIHQLLHNLLTNAIKFVGDRPPRIHITATAESDGWRVSVRDNGIGMKADDSDRIFVMFQRLHTHDEYPGTGIGLALVKKFVQLMGGTVAAANRGPRRRAAGPDRPPAHGGLHPGRAIPSNRQPRPHRPNLGCRHRAAQV